MWRQGLEVLRLGEVLWGVFLELVVQALTGIDDLQGLVVELHTETQAACGHHVLSGQDADGDLSFFRQVYIVLQFRAAAVSGPFFHYVVGSHAAVAATKSPQDVPSVKAGVYLPLRIDKVDGRNSVFF